MCTVKLVRYTVVLGVVQQRSAHIDAALHSVRVAGAGWGCPSIERCCQGSSGQGPGRCAPISSMCGACCEVSMTHCMWAPSSGFGATRSFAQRRCCATCLRRRCELETPQLLRRSRWATATWPRTRSCCVHCRVACSRYGLSVVRLPSRASSWEHTVALQLGHEQAQQYCSKLLPSVFALLASLLGGGCGC